MNTRQSDRRSQAIGILGKAEYQVAEIDQRVIPGMSVEYQSVTTLSAAFHSLALVLHWPCTVMRDCWLAGGRVLSCTIFHLMVVKSRPKRVLLLTPVPALRTTAHHLVLLPSSD
jgi:hypothetical protein